LELAESEFLDLRKSKIQYQRSVAVQVEAQVPDLLTDSLSLKSLIQTDSLVAEIDNAIAALAETTVSTDEPTDTLLEMWSQLANLAGMKTLQEVRQSLRKHQVAIVEFARRFREEVHLPSLTVPVSVRPRARGISIFNLNFFLLSLQGRDAIVDFLRIMNVSTVKWDPDHVVSIAQEVMATNKDASNAGD
jgi:hypothetical protein